MDCYCHKVCKFGCRGLCSLSSLWEPEGKYDRDIALVLYLYMMALVIGFFGGAFLGRGVKTYFNTTTQ